MNPESNIPPVEPQPVAESHSAPAPTKAAQDADGEAPASPPEEIDLNLLFPDEGTDLNHLFPEPEMRDLLKKLQKNKNDLGRMKDRFRQDHANPDAEEA